jgi:DNA-binding transcriptional LysR family regulator
MSITTRQLEIIRSVILSGSVTNTASQLGISQPAVSRLLKDCEERIGFALFARKQGRLQPTSEAKALLPELNRIFESVERLQRQADELREMKAGSIQIATTPVLADTLLPRVIDRFLVAHPKVQLTIRNMLNMEVVERVAMDEADLGLALSPDNYRGSTVIDLHKTELIGIVPTGHPLVAKGHIDLEDAMRFPLISFSRLLPLGAALDRLFQQRGQQRRVAIEVSQSTTALAMVRQGIGIALVDPFILIDAKPSGIVRLKLTTSVPIAAQLLIPHHEQISRLSKSLVKHIRAVLAELVAKGQI